MKNKTTIWIKIVILSILTLALVGVLIAGILGKGFGSIPFFSTISSYDHADRYQVGNAELDAPTLKKLSIDWISGNVSIKTYDGQTIKIYEPGSENRKDSDRVHYYYQDGALYIQFRESGSIFSFFHDLKNKDLEISIPETLAGSISEISGDVVSANTTITGISTDKFSLDTVSGDLSFDGNVNKVDSDSVSGKCNITSHVTPQSVDMESVSGDISLCIPENSDFEAEKDSVSGDLTCGFSSTSSNDKITCGAGTNKYDFETVSGDINIIPNK